MVGWHHWLNGHEFEQTLGDGEGQGSLASCSSWGHRVRHDWATKQWQPSLQQTLPNSRCCSSSAGSALSPQLLSSITKLIIFVLWAQFLPCFYPRGEWKAQQCLSLPISLRSMMIEICKWQSQTLCSLVGRVHIWGPVVQEGKTRDWLGIFYLPPRI